MALKRLGIFQTEIPQKSKIEIFHFQQKTSALKNSLAFLESSSILTRQFLMQQIGAFRPLRRAGTRLRHRRMSWIVSIYHLLLQLKKSNARISHIRRFLGFESWLRETERLRKLKKSVKTSGYYLSIVNWWLNNIIYNILWPLSLAQSALKAQ